jgi:hypothetical protein
MEVLCSEAHSQHRMTVVMEMAWSPFALVVYCYAEALALEVQKKLYSGVDFWAAIEEVSEAYLARSYGVKLWHQR